MAFFEWIENSGLAETVAVTPNLTALISAIHLVGLTLVAGGAAVSGLQLLGRLLPEEPAGSFVRAVRRGMLVGMTLSISTGLLLFAPRATSAVANGTFQLKMLLLLSALVFHFTAGRAPAGGDGALTPGHRVALATGGLLWVAVAVAGSVYILFE